MCCSIFSVPLLSSLHSRLRHGPLEGVKFLVEVVPILMTDFLPPVQVLQMVVTEFVSPHQPRPTLAAMVMGEVSETGTLCVHVLPLFSLLYCGPTPSLPPPPSSSLSSPSLPSLPLLSFLSSSFLPYPCVPDILIAAGPKPCRPCNRLGPALYGQLCSTVSHKHYPEYSRLHHVYM